MKPNPDQTNIFVRRDATGTLKPVKTKISADPFIGHLNRINPIKREHYNRFIISDKYKRDIDKVFRVLEIFDDLTDREIQKLTGLETSSIPARRKDVTDDSKLYKNFEIVESQRRRCGIKGTWKMSWRLKRVD